MVRGLVSCAILGGTVLGFNVIAATTSGAALNTPVFIDVAGGVNGPTIQYDGTGQFGWAFGNTTATNSCPAGAVTVPGVKGLFNCGSQPNTAFQPNPPTPTAGAIAATGTAPGDIIPGSQTFLTDPANTETSQSFAGTACATGTGDATNYKAGQKLGNGNGDGLAGSPTNVFQLSQAPVTPAKNDLSDVYTVARTNPVTGDKELYFGMERTKANGDVAITMEFSQQGATLSGTCAHGRLTTNRSAGDFALEFDFGGSSFSPTLYKWVCPTPTTCNAGSYDAGTALSSAQETLSFNSVAIPCGGWVCRDTSGATTTVPAGGFETGVIDLSLSGVGATCASSFMADSHTSSSQTSDFSDLVGPGPFATCPTPPMTTTPVLTSGTTPTIGSSWSDTAQVNTTTPPGTAPTGQVTFYSCSPSVLAAHSASTCSSAIGTLIPGTVSFPNPATLTPGTTSSTATSPPITPNATGTWCFAGYYGGESGVYQASSDANIDECFPVGPATPVLDTQMTTPSQTSVGNSWNDAATVTGNTVGGAPTGSVAFSLCKEATIGTPCTTGGTPIATLTAPTGTSGDVSTYTLPGADAQTPTVGGYCFLVSYAATSGGNYSSVGAQDDTECFTVTPATPGFTTAIVAPPGSPPDTSVGNTWHDNATVFGNSTGGAPTGSVAFTWCKESVPGTACTGTSGGGSAGTFTTPAVSGNNSTFGPSNGVTPGSVGTYCFNAAYSATTGGNYSSVTQQTDNECFSVTPAGSTTTTQQSITSAGAASIIIGADGSVSDTVKVQGNTTGGPPTGHVDFFICYFPTGGDQLCPSGTQVGGDVTLVPQGGTDYSTAPSAAFSPLNAVGTYCFSAVYTPDSTSNYNGSTDNQTGSVDHNECVTVNPATPGFLTTINGPTDTSVGNSWTDSAKVSGNTLGGPPSGTVAWTWCKESAPSTPCTGTSGGGSAGSSNVPSVSGDDSTFGPSSSVTPGSVGTYCFNASYTATTGGNYNSVSQQTDTECFTVTPATPGFTTTINPPTDTSVGNSWTDSATVSGNSTGGPPSGTVSWSWCKESTPGTPCTGTAGGGSAGSSSTPSITGDNSTFGPSSSATPGSAGIYCFNAVYTATTGGNYSSVSQQTDTECFTVGAATPVLDTQLTSPSQTTVGNSWDDTATVTGNTTGGAPTGSVSFDVCKETTVGTPCTTGGTSVATLTAPTGTSGDVSTYTLPPTDAQTPTVGGYCFLVSYSATPGGNYNSVPVQDDTECFIVTPATPTSMTTINAPTNTSVGNSWTDSATITGNSTGGAPTGTVSWTWCKESAPSTPCTGTTGGGSAGSSSTPAVNGDASTFGPSSSVTPGSVGTYCFNAAYAATSGGNYVSVSQQSDTECFTVTPAGSTTHTVASTTTQSGPGSVVIDPSLSVTDGVTVTGNSTGGAPAGTVTFYACGPTSAPALCAPGSSNQVGAVKTLSPGTGDQSTATSDGFGPVHQVGFYCFSAVYTPATGSNYSGSSDNVTGDIQSNECFDVTPATSLTTTQQSTSTSGSGSINLGGSITDTATVAGNSAGGAPTGSVTFTVCGPMTSSATCPAGSQVGSPKTLSAVPDSSNSTATSDSFTPTSVGIYCFAAVYTPNSGANYLGSNDNVTGDVQATECFLVTRPDFKVLKTDTPGNSNPVQPGSTIPYTITIQNIGNGGGPATVQDTLPSYLTIQGTPTCAVTGANTCSVTNPSGSTWQFDVTLAPGDTATVTFNATLAATDTVDDVNTATITNGNCVNGQAPSDRSHAAVNNCSSTVTNPVPDFTVTKTDGPGNNTPVAPGSTIPYTVAIKNVGDGAGAGTITDTLPPNLTIQGTPTCAVTGSDTCKVTNTTGSTWTFAVNLAAGNTATATFSAVVAASATGNIVNTATITTGSCNTSAGCSSTVSNPVIVTLPTTTTTTTVPPKIAFTGADISALIAAALALLGLGGFLVMLSRRRQQAGDSGKS